MSMTIAEVAVEGGPFAAMDSAKVVFEQGGAVWFICADMSVIVVKYKDGKITSIDTAEVAPERYISFLEAALNHLGRESIKTFLSETLGRKSHD